MLTRLLFTLLPLLIVSGAVQGEEKKSPNREAAAKVIAERIGTATLEKAMLDALKRHPAADRWSGVEEKQIFGLAVVPFTERDVEDGDVGMLRKSAALLAAKEMLFAKVLLDKYAASGLTDAGTLREAVADANESFSVQAKIAYDVNETRIENNRIVGIAVADREKVLATMTDRARINEVRTAYQKLVHRQAKRSIVAGQFEEALTRLLELHRAQLLQRAQLFDVLRCFVGLDKPADAEKIIANLTAEHVDDLKLHRRLATIVEPGGETFSALIQKLRMEIDRLDPPAQSAEEVFDQFMQEISERSDAQ